MIAIEVRDNFGELRSALVVASTTWQNWSPFFSAWADLWFESRREMFRTAGESTDTPWPMYSRATGEAQYAAVKSKILGRRMTRADLLRWIGGNEILKPSLEGEGPAAIREETATKITVGTSVPYAHKHDRGEGRGPSWAGSHRIPKREILNLGIELERSTATMLGKFAAAGLSSIQGERVGLTTDEVRAMISEGWQ